MYADDLEAYLDVTPSYLDRGINEMSEESLAIERWAMENKLVLNAKKNSSHNIGKYEIYNQNLRWDYSYDKPWGCRS